MRTPASYSHLEVVTRSGHRLIIPYPSSFGAPDGNFVRFLDGRKNVMLTVAVDDFSYSLARNKSKSEKYIILTDKERKKCAAYLRQQSENLPAEFARDRQIS